MRIIKLTMAILTVIANLAYGTVNLEQLQAFTDDPSRYDNSQHLAQRFAPLVFFIPVKNTFLVQSNSS